MLIEKTYSVSGIVQGVGVRPLCVRVARLCGRNGSVATTSDGVLLRRQGTEQAVSRYLEELRAHCPDVSLIIEITLLEEKAIDAADDDFVIMKSVRSERQRVLLPPDMATCKDCLADIRDAHNRRFRYPFTNCTNCGPRCSIVRTLPYDRPCTTMSIFPMCPECEREYRDEENRRFHAQPNACPDCGPHLFFTDSKGHEMARNDEALRLTVQWLKQGKIMAIKGLGGFHLACDATNEKTVALLRSRKKRPRRPFAVMVRDLAEARRIVSLDEDDERLLSGARAPILLLPLKAETPLAPSIAPGLDRLGVMLPYTPLHHLLLEEICPLVMTSANLSGSPLVSQNDEALQELAHICDGFLLHDRPIHMKIDDSVLLSRNESPVIIRRARGFVPNPVIAARELAPVVAAGAEMKGTFAFSQDTMIFPSQYLGDMKELGTARFYSQAMEHFKQLYNFAPRALVHDLHPLFVSTAQAKKAFPALPTLAVQHHYAHMMACLAENRAEVRAIGLILDGTGYGTDGTIWGGEVLA
ncbi:MAG: carbamoyltransferase HypF, partial [Pyramidobacter sp.]|nr:carbamoyltransferase HypF [Pyramidobacter sp.]